MQEFKLLLTGDYWHQDFQDLVQANHNCTTLMPLQDLGACDPSMVDPFSLIVIAQSRRNQFEAKILDSLLVRFPHVPIIALSGSWCEGEMRSGDPTPGLVRVYWHQWLGRLNHFQNQVVGGLVATWNLPRTYSMVDQVIHDTQQPSRQFDRSAVVGIGALTPSSFEMLNDVCQTTGLETIWLDTVVTPSELEVLPQLLLVDGNSMNGHFVQRIRKLLADYPVPNIVATLNFPRQYDLKTAKAEGITHVVSKPFQVCDLQLMICDCLSEKFAA